jgi:hypothetical protein
MAHDRNRFKHDQMPTLRTFLSASGIEFRDGKGAHQLLQINIPGAGWQALCVSNTGVVTSPPALRQVATGFQCWLKAVNTVPADHAPYKGEKAFQNFHRSLCERFGAVHDPVDWWRDTVSLEEHIASLIAQPAPAPTPAFLDDLRDDIAMHALQGLLAAGHKKPVLDLTNEAYAIADCALYSRGKAKRDAQRARNEPKS